MSTLKEIIDRIDKDKVNDYDNEQKTRWINEINKGIWHRFYEGREGYETYDDLNYDRDKDRELLCDSEYDCLFDYYVYSKIDYFNNEINNFNNSGALFQNKYDEFVRYMIRSGYLQKQPTFKNIVP